MKQYIVNQNIAVAFAGNKRDFEEDLSQILKCENSEDIVNMVLHANKQYDLIIADLKGAELIFIKDGILGLIPYSAGLSACPSKALMQQRI